MDFSRLASATVVAAACSLGIYAVATAANETDPDSSASAPSDATAGGAIPAAVRTMLAEEGIEAKEITPAQAAEAGVRADDDARSLAVAAARASFGLSTTSVARSVTLVSMTTRTPPTGSAQQRPEYRDRIVWLVTLDGVRNPYLGPQQSHIPKGVPGIMMTPIDARTGEVLFAIVD